ncbi:hypothetical protein MTR67_013352 [Solanum verrucosum]|uniref:RRM domain-containing protein n=1 Tax=Solanum verrucosum TaxID=315347 RepID=A0AAF0QBP2_SOLVR|nr:hypothetical protein MTR67_013352 [Solanum verrucosum]
MASAHEVHHHFLGTNNDREVVDTQSIGLADDRGVSRVEDTQSIELAYDRYLQSLVNAEADNARDNYKGIGLGRGTSDCGVPAHPVRDLLHSALGPELAPNGRNRVFMKRPRETLPLPHGASSTLYIEGLPLDISRREVAHIFRPFAGYKEVRLVRRDSKHVTCWRSSYPWVCGFANPACAATALSALQGYKMDEHDINSAYLRLQFSKFPGPRFGGSGSRGKR